MTSTVAPPIAEQIAAVCAQVLLTPDATLAALQADCTLARSGQGGVGLAALLYGSALLQAGDGVASLEALSEADADARATGDDALRLQVMVSRSKALTITGDLQGALECFGEGMDLSRALGDRHTEGLLLLGLGFFHGQLEESVPYEEYTRLALARFRELGDPQRVALCLNNLGGSISRRKRYAEALACYEEALPIALGLGWRRGQALILAGHGGVLFHQGHIDEGKRRYLASNAILEELGDVFQITRHLNLLGRALLEGGRPAEALPCLELAVRHAEARRFEIELSVALELLSRAHEALDDAPSALRALRRHVEEGAIAGNRRTEEVVRKLKLEHRLSIAKREAQQQESRNDELAAVNAALTEAMRQQQALQAELERLARTDPLTGLFNRRHMDALGDREIERSRRSRAPLAVMLADVDHFKRINDRYGHAVGDEVLVEMAARLQANVRGGDLVARWGGEEFCVLLVDTDDQGARLAAERVRRAIAQRPFETSAGPLKVTLSLGVVALDDGPARLSSLLRQADAALYTAKARGRDQYCLAPTG
ncbi:MAG: GGDEF domain-containing protein [Deltaproteobacteria bacterium]|nr:GGDEF domain-containing protein [Deltaproteobacteria bacterium]